MVASAVKAAVRLCSRLRNQLQRQSHPPMKVKVGTNLVQNAPPRRKAGLGLEPMRARARQGR